MALCEILIHGHIPSKKNLLKLTRSGRGYYDKDVRERLDAIAREVASQWRDVDGDPLPALVHPAIGVVFYTATQNSDRDNAYTTLQDALVAGGVLRDDCIRHNNGLILIGHALPTPTGVWGARMFIESKGQYTKIIDCFNQLDLTDHSWLSLGKAKVVAMKAPTKSVGSLGRKAA